MFETYRMLGEQREADLLHEARRLQAGASVHQGARRRSANLDSPLALARRAMGKVTWPTRLTRHPSSILILSPRGSRSDADDSGLPIDKLPVAAIEVVTENEKL
jgi:hypothetical protein